MQVNTSKQIVTDEKGTILKEMYFVTLSTAIGAYSMNIGKKSYEGIRKLNEEKYIAKDPNDTIGKDNETKKSK